MPNEPVLLTCSNKFGNILISKEDVYKYIDEHIDFVIDEDVCIVYMNIDDLANGKQIFNIIFAVDKSQSFDSTKIDCLFHSLNIIFKNYLGISFENINIGVKYLNE